jgi:hypothetical protein
MSNRRSPYFNPQQAVEKRPCLPAGRHLRRSTHPSSLQRTPKYASGRLTNSSAWQDVAPYSSRRHSQDFGRLASACLREAASAKAGAFLISLKKMSFSTGSQYLIHQQ